MTSSDSDGYWKQYRHVCISQEEYESIFLYIYIQFIHREEREYRFGINETLDENEYDKVNGRGSQKEKNRLT